MKTIKKKLIEKYNNNYYFLLSFSLFFIIGTLAIVWTLYNQSVSNRFDINNITGLEDVEYLATYYEEVSEPYVTIEANQLEDVHMVEIQRALLENKQVKVPVYWVKNSSEFVPTGEFYQDGLRKKSDVVSDGLHEVIKFEHLYSSENEPNSVNEWDIDKGSYKNGVYHVVGKMSDDANSLEKYTQLRALTDMIIVINKDNDKLLEVPLLLEFETGDDKVLYHSDYDDVLGKSSLYKAKKIEP